MAPSMLIRFLGVDPAIVAAVSQAEQDRVKSIVASVQPLSRRFAGINIDSSPDFHELPLERITAPALIISARDDLFNTRPAAEHAAAKMGNAKLIVYDHGGHLLVGHQEDVVKEVRAFLASKGLYATHS
jgi:pimeloyl-ACP methyl ester carboxylesterase